MRVRKDAEKFGRFGEKLGGLYLRLKGYRIVARQYRTRVGEIDIIARRGGVLVFVEVKARETVAAAETAITTRQRTRIERAASAFLQDHAGLSHLDIRFDALLIVRRRLPIHIVDAWRPGY